MGELASRLARLEKLSGSRRSNWSPPWVELAGQDPTPEEEARIRATEREALAAGWKPSDRTPYVVIVHMPGGDDDGLGGDAA